MARTTCRNCAGSGQITDHSRVKYQESNRVFYHKKTCSLCGGTGYEYQPDSKESSGNANPGCMVVLLALVGIMFFICVL